MYNLGLILKKRNSVFDGWQELRGHLLGSGCYCFLQTQIKHIIKTCFTVIPWECISSLWFWNYKQLKRDTKIGGNVFICEAQREVIASKGESITGEGNYNLYC